MNAKTVLSGTIWLVSVLSDELTDWKICLVFIDTRMGQKIIYYFFSSRVILLTSLCS